MNVVSRRTELVGDIVHHRCSPSVSRTITGLNFLLNYAEILFPLQGNKFAIIIV